jgi:hypothetical protein
MFELRASCLQSRSQWTSSPFCSSYFGEGGFLWALCLDWPWTLVLLISASQVARIIGMGHWLLTELLFFMSTRSKTSVSFTETISFYFFLVVVLEFELRALHLLVRCSITWATLPAFFFCELCVLGIFQDRVLRTICPGWLQTAVFLISAFWVARITWLRSFNMNSTDKCIFLSHLLLWSNVRNHRLLLSLWILKVLGFFFIFYFWWHWGLNSGPLAC